MSDGSQDDLPIDGYLSEVGKRRFTAAVVVLGLVFFIAQFALPLIIMASFAIASASDFDPSVVAIRDPYRAEIWNGEIWWVELDSFAQDDKETGVLYRAHFDDLGSKHSVGGFSNDPPFLLGAAEGLWLISENSVALWQDGQARIVDRSAQLGEFSVPFLFNGRPAVIERWPDSFALRVHDGESWRTRGTLPATISEPDESGPVVKVVAAEGEEGLHVFVESGDSLFYGPWDPASTTEIDWELIGEAGEDWCPVLWQGNLSVIVAGSSHQGRVVQANVPTDQGRKTYSIADRPHGDRIKADTEPGSNRLTVFLGFTHGITIDLRQFDPETTGLTNGQIGVGTHGPTAIKRTSLMLIAPFAASYLLPVPLVAIVSMLMRRCRHDSYATNGKFVRHATLMRRMVAQFIDAAVVVGPAGLSLVIIWRFSAAGSDPGPGSLLDALGAAVPPLVSISFGWILLMGVVLVIAEGRTGMTPGKWATRIRVFGADLRPCGFGRALIRNLFKVVDGFFCFLVGVMVAALSKHWQRLGDMAASTVVIDARSIPKGKHGTSPLDGSARNPEAVTQPVDDS
jgi:uncharacterized RDD family membrane protein YckC